MSKIEDGGPAFPAGAVRKSRPAHDPGADFRVTDITDPKNGGMTLRDYFAAKVMPSCYAEYCAYANAQGYSEDWKMGVALASYAMADAMLKAREAE